MDWQPIETAPRDGTLVWLLHDGDLHIGHYEPPAWDSDGCWVLRASFRRPKEVASIHYRCSAALSVPTRWMPLPAPPTDGD